MKRAAVSPPRNSGSVTPVPTKSARRAGGNASSAAHTPMLSPAAALLKRISTFASELSTRTNGDLPDPATLVDATAQTLVPAPTTAISSPSEPTWTSQVTARDCTKAVLRLVQVWVRPATRPAAEPVLEALLARMPQWRASRFLGGFTLSMTAWKSVNDMSWDQGRYLPTLVALLKVCPAPPDVLAMLVTQLPRAIHDFAENPALVVLIYELLSRTSSSQAVVEDRALLRLSLGFLVERAESEQLYVGADGNKLSSVTFCALSTLIKTCRASNVAVAHWAVDPRLCRVLVVALRGLTAPVSSTLSAGNGDRSDSRSVLNATATVFHSDNPCTAAYHLELIALVSALLERFTIPPSTPDDTSMTDPLPPPPRTDLVDMSTAVDFLMSLLPMSPGAPLRALDGTLVASLTRIYNLVTVSLIGDPPSLGFEILDFDLAVQCLRVLVFLCQWSSAVAKFVEGAPDQHVLFAQRLVAAICCPLQSATVLDSAASETLRLTVRRYPGHQPKQPKSALQRKALKLVTQLMPSWQVGNLIVEHGLVPLLDFSRTIMQPNRIDAEQLPLLCMIWRQVTESSLARLKIRATLARTFAETMAVLAHQVFAHADRGLVKFLPKITRPFIGDTVPLAHLAHVLGPVVIDYFLTVQHDHTIKHLVVLISTLGYAPDFQTVVAPHLVAITRSLLEVGYVDPVRKWVENTFQLIPYQDQPRVLAQVLYPAVHDGHVDLVRTLLTTFDDKTTLKANHVLCRAAVFFLDPMRARRHSFDWTNPDLDWTDAAVRMAAAVIGIWLVESGAVPTDSVPALDDDLHSPPAPAHPGTDHVLVTLQLHDGTVDVCRLCLARTSAAFSALLTGAFAEATHVIIPIPDASAVTVHDFVRAAIAHEPLVDWIRTEKQFGYAPRALVHRLVDLAVLAERYLVEDVVARVTQVLADLTDPRSAVVRSCATVGSVEPVAWPAFPAATPAIGGSATPLRLPTVESPGAPDSPSYSGSWSPPGSPTGTAAAATSTSTTTPQPVLRLGADPGASIRAAIAQEWAAAVLHTVLALDATPRYPDLWTLLSRPVEAAMVCFAARMPCIRGDDAVSVHAILARFLTAHAAAAVGGDVAEDEDEEGGEVE
ncbi:hypothetical protein AMAG_05294 [Allomyces macrogynus ATCC 38327]|uniref:BTB domain-containing protein n=1 Tax=Allomyces macrogynus (strain ATCC 38327) TaxID=578462 RepID=A0A0L0SBR1_ALLM3|nr:hypothetical protein AMAG_05294 [Allomyces macrogynus ATCC 38327]|eukprot:KNE59840.1 hypothetical protein AMAG_05294 [Allomyces macrogynus ATCC 38327]